MDRDFIGGTEVNRLRGNLSIPMDDYRSNLPNRYAGGLIFSNPDNQPFSRPTDPGSLRYYMNSPAVRDGWKSLAGSPSSSRLKRSSSGRHTGAKEQRVQREGLSVTGGRWVLALNSRALATASTTLRRKLSVSGTRTVELSAW